MAINLDSLAGAYLLRDNDRANHLVAFDTVCQLVENDPEQAWQFILTAIARITEDSDLAYLAAGPIEDLLKIHGLDFIERIEDEARKSDKMLRALSSVYIDSSYESYSRWFALMEKYGFNRGERTPL
jgi:hypothetical protein